MKTDAAKGKDEGEEGTASAGGAKEKAGTEEQVEAAVKPSAPGETGTTPGTNWG